MKNTRVWIFPSAEPIALEIQEKIITHFNHFFQNWQAHGQDLSAKVEVLENHFVKVAVDESVANATGCSIDKLTKLVFGIQEKYKVQLLERMFVYAKKSNGVEAIKLSKAREQLQKEPVEGVFNTAVANQEEFEKTWLMPAHESPATKRFFW